MLTVPRVAVSYASYAAASVFVFKFNSRAILVMVVLISCIFTSFYINLLRGYTVSLTAVVIEFALMFNFFCYLCGVTFRGTKEDAVYFIRCLNLFVFALSLVNLTRNGFPFKLPYIDYLPDVYGALFGSGGARTVTVIGFFGLAIEIFLQKPQNRLWIMVAACNFIIPSYLIGCFCGGLGLAAAYAKKTRYIIVGIPIGIVVGLFALTRLENINDSFTLHFGMHPKLIANAVVLEFYADNVLNFIFGSSIGQFCSTAALWASDYYAQLYGGKDLPSIPGMYMSDFHATYLGEYLSYGAGDIWSINSSMNKPYTSWAAIFSEFGFIVALLIVYLLKKSVALHQVKEARLVLVFVASIFAIDIWHDSIWLGVLLVAYARVVRRV
jgi:hypothetical protein